jgi:hypothetical protein
MMNKKTTKELQLDEEQTTRLLKLGLNDSEAPACQDHENHRRELLSDMLGSKLPVDRMLMKELPILIKSLSDELDAISGLSFRDCLTNPKTNPAILRRIKNFAKNSGASSKDQTRGEVSKIVYFSAVAAALAFHGTRISRHSYRDLLNSFQLCSNQSWTPNDLTELFVKAKDICQRRLIEQEGLR